MELTEYRNMNKPYLIAIAGPSGVGKSSISKALQKEIVDIKLIISLDDYFKDPNTFPRFEKWINWDLPEDLDFNLLYRDLTELKQGRKITISVLNKATLKREEKTVKPALIILVEGFLILYDRQVRDLFDLKIFINTPIEVQMERRMERDVNRDEDYLRKVVVPNYKKYGLPTKKVCRLHYRWQ